MAGWYTYIKSLGSVPAIIISRERLGGSTLEDRPTNYIEIPEKQEVNRTIRIGNTFPIQEEVLEDPLNEFLESQYGTTSQLDFFKSGDMYHIPNPGGTVPITIVDRGGDNIQEDRRNPSDEITRNYMGIMKYHEENIAEKLKST